MLRQTMKCALLALALFSSAAFLLAVSRGVDGGEILVRMIVVFPMLIVFSTITTAIIYAIAAGAAALAKQSSLVAASISGILGWITASGGYRSFEGLGGYSDLIQPAYAISLVAPWLILALKNRAR
ncbi:hypothetical protein JQ594_21390 [Bradyrhizobium manausense]|uniref:hypothetical protein n=1 Tax=Bradyrhizobium manausense TaxID=989370 RepID=UPI001BA786D5|nr:hypothetical protein [Bradyrhizobium manausense]MBR0688495.1 hypothetical protein [Bradyrhizobium manausense]MBR0720844.1 hypothetical protein [Bradyrhizobium manausense]